MMARQRWSVMGRLDEGRLSFVHVESARLARRVLGARVER
jgi:hypothetical protein